MLPPDRRVRNCQTAGSPAVSKVRENPNCSGVETLYPSTLDLYKERMKGYPEITVTDRGARAQRNFNQSAGKVKHVFLGRREDVAEGKRDFCHRARSATEGLIAVAKHWRGFGKSLYRGFTGDKIWSGLCQMAFNLHKLLKLYREEKIKEESLVKLGLA